MVGGRGCEGEDNSFNFGGYRSYWWTATEIDDKKAVNRMIFSSDSNGTGGERGMGNSKDIGFSVRCVGD